MAAASTALPERRRDLSRLSTAPSRGQTGPIPAPSRSNSASVPAPVSPTSTAASPAGAGDGRAASSARTAAAVLQAIRPKAASRLQLIPTRALVIRPEMHAVVHVVRVLSAVAPANPAVERLLFQVVLLLR